MAAGSENEDGCGKNQPAKESVIGWHWLRELCQKFRWSNSFTEEADVASGFGGRIGGDRRWESCRSPGGNWLLNIRGWQSRSGRRCRKWADPFAGGLWRIRGGRGGFLPTGFGPGR